MKKEYDFSKAERGKFYRSDLVLSLPVYLDPDISDFLTKRADERHVALERLVNDWLRVTIDLYQQDERSPACQHVT